MTERPTILFLCPHSAAKSVLAAADFDRLARRRGLSYQAAFAGTEPDDEIAPRVAALLQAEDIDVSRQRPRRVTRRMLAEAHRVISLGCDLASLAPPSVPVEHWDDVPPPSQDLDATRGAIQCHLMMLIAELERGGHE